MIEVRLRVRPELVEDLSHDELRAVLGSLAVQLIEGRVGMAPLIGSVDDD